MSSQWPLRWRKVVLREFVSFVIATFVVSSVCFPQAKRALPEKPVFRAPFKLKIHLEGERVYEQSFGRIPYVADNDVYLFAGEAFGLNVTVTGGEISRITYERNPAKADVELRFTQQKLQNRWMMILVIRNKLNRKLYLDAVMTIPGKDELYKTSVLPVEPKLSDFESWPRPIVQLVLRDLRFCKQPKERTNP